MTLQKKKKKQYKKLDDNYEFDKITKKGKPAFKYIIDQIKSTTAITIFLYIIKLKC